ncbi:T9SS type A sorting domain-containing protein [Hymenobacter cellulosilyticus]|uniref:T9SS type A sorting domain-containing protein n=1 Tax=Hymenobacter cellulosilyticus TaxID=2932248 RepID=A0A8T9QG34_9BACT|nr:T9SS type A sorting domain-containing protein [Hymenobacter cellulosilyticus]UOQ75118.1 T9SS type A sorting domain-containing protein [Hymenobacter cellulosilyticus]
MRFVPALAQLYSATLPVASTDVPTQEPITVSGTGVAPIYPATVQSAPVTAITATQATAGGTISNEGNSTVTERGVVYSTSANPTLSDESTVDGAGSGSFTSTLMGLKPNTRYVVRAYATNEVGTSYGQEISFTTAPVALAAEPTQSSTLTASELTPTSVLLTASGGTGSKRLFLATQSADLLSVPTDGTTYAGNSTVGQGDQPAPGIYVVAAGPATSVTITGLQPNTEYTFAVFDYNDDNTTGAENYRTQDPGKRTLTTPEQPAQLLLEENFLYAAAERLTDHGWNAHSAAGTNPVLVSSAGLSRSDYNATGGNAAALTGTGEDVHRTFAPVAAGTPVYASFLVQVNSAPGTDYFFHLGPDPISTTFRARVLVKPAATTGKIQFGVSGSGTTAVYDPTEYELGTSYLLVVRYNFGSTGTETRLYVNPGVSEPAGSNATSAEAASSSPANIGSVALRQGSSTSPLLLDGLRVGTTFAVVRQQVPAPLPVQLVAFTGQVQQRSVVLRWATAQELQNDRFEVERAQGDGQIFTRIATVAGRGTTTAASTYAYTDADVVRPGQQLRYRLRQVDHDGKATYSPVVVLSAPAAGQGQALRALPNPARDQVRLEGATADVAQLLDLTGRLLRTVNAAESISLQGLTPGIYIIRCGTGTTRLQVE